MLKTLSEHIKDTQLTAISLVPTVLNNLLAEKANYSELRQLKFILLGGEPISRTLLERSRAARLPVISSYGLTESSSAIALNKDPKPDNEYISAGGVLPHASIKVLGKQNKALKSYQHGQLAIKRAQPVF
jgi:O-succinylbenzoic acid--CoA ligase